VALGKWFSRRGNIEMSLDAGVRRVLGEFLGEFAGRMKWDDDATRRLRGAGEETLMNLVERDDASAAGARRLRVAVRSDGGDAVIDFLAAPQGTNLEEQMGQIRDRDTPVEGRDLSLRLLRHYASSVSHRQYHAIDLLTVRVKGSR
jgi:anti-sigma regulatory factor (Ser/Thr protein kinase)